MADALTSAYDQAAAMAGPGGTTVMRLGKELGAKPPGTVTVIHSDPSAWSADPQAAWGLAYELLTALLEAKLTKLVPFIPEGPEGKAPNEKPWPWIRRPDLGAWARPEVLLLVGSFLNARKPNKDTLVQAARHLSGELGNGSKMGPVAGEGPLPPLFRLLEFMLYAVMFAPPAVRPSQGGLLGGLGPERDNPGKEWLEQRQRDRNWKNAGILASIGLAFAYWWSGR